MEMSGQENPEEAATRDALISFFELRSYDELAAWLSTHGPKRRSALLRLLLRKRSEGNGGLEYSAWIDLLLDLEKIRRRGGSGAKPSSAVSSNSPRNSTPSSSPTSTRSIARRSTRR